MQRRQLWMLNTVLAVSVLVLAWRLVGEWQRGNERYGRLAQQSGRSGPAYVLPATSQQALPSGSEVIAKNLFTSERNSEVAPSARLDAPPVPVVFGTMQLGPGYEALMAEGGPEASRGFRRLKSGEQIGPYTVVEIQDEKVVVEFQGQRTTIDVYQSANSVTRTQARTVPAAAAPVVEAVSGPPPSSATPAPTGSAAAAGPTAPSSGVAPGVRVTIEGNRKKFERDSPFGTQTWYEEIQK